MTGASPVLPCHSSSPLLNVNSSLPVRHLVEYARGRRHRASCSAVSKRRSRAQRPSEPRALSLEPRTISAHPAPVMSSNPAVIDTSCFDRPPAARRIRAPITTATFRWSPATTSSTFSMRSAGSSSCCSPAALKRTATSATRLTSGRRRNCSATSTTANASSPIAPCASRAAIRPPSKASTRTTTSATLASTAALARRSGRGLHRRPPRDPVLFRNLDPEAWTRRGIANNNEVSVRAIAYSIAGHNLHHRSISKNVISKQRLKRRHTEQLVPEANGNGLG